MTTKLLRNAINLALYSGATVLLTAAGSAAAQENDALESDSARELQKMTVVGSRIKRTDIETSQPVFVLEREDLKRSGLVSVGDILQQLTTNGASLNTTFNNGGNGQTLVNLRNLGSNRTLVLVNGRRWVSGLAGTVDLNTMPITIIERIEVLKDGASSIYGSDAIGGVINITTRDTFDGAEASAYVGEYEDGDGRTQQYDFTLGSSTDRANVVMNASYTKIEPVIASDREISAVPLFGFPSNTSAPGQASSTTPFGRLGVNGIPGTVTLIPGRPGTAASDFKPYSFATDGFNFAPTNYLLTPQERTAVYAQGRYALTDTIQFKTEVLFNERRSEQLLAPTPITLSSNGIFGTGLLQVGVSPDSIYNPFGALINRVQFRPINQGRSFNQEVDTFRFGGGFDGTFDFADRSFSWDVNYVYSKNEDNRTTFGLYNLQNIGLGIGPSFRDAQGNAMCGTAAAPITGCVPLNFTGGPDGFTDAMYNYIAFTAHDVFENELRNYSANLTGDLFELPSGPLSFAAGYEYRQEEGFDQPDALTSSGVSTGNIRQPTAGGFSLNEFYVEFNVPVLKDAPLAQTLEFSIAARYSDYSTFGDTTNAKFGFRWKPIDDLLVRGNYSEGFRAPNISELFAGQADSFPQLLDPCSQSANPTPAVRAACTAAGVPANYEQANSQIRITVGSNPNLTPELATTKTVGVVYSPSYVEGLDIFLDWYDVKLDNTISALGAQFILNGCFVGGNQSLCQLITRGPTGDVTGLLNAGLNIGSTHVEGFDLTVDYKFDTDYGKFRVNWDSAYQVDNTTVTPNISGPPTVTNQVGFLFGAARTPFFRLRSNVDLSWSYGDFGATLGARYLSGLDEDCSGAANTAAALSAAGINTANPCSKPNVVGVIFGGPENHLGSITYWDLQGTWDTPWDGRITLGVNNIFEREPPVSYSAFANSFDPQYDVPGRFWYVSYSQKF
jgi:iron complex outermembrane receptor protein